MVLPDVTQHTMSTQPLHSNAAWPGSTSVDVESEMRPLAPVPPSLVWCDGTGARGGGRLFALLDGTCGRGGTRGNTNSSSTETLQNHSLLNS